MPKNCKNCGAEMPEEAHFCLYCLTETEEKTIITTNDKNSFFTNKKRAIALIATVLLIILLILICIFCFGNKNPNPANNNENKTAVSTVTQDDGSVVTEYDDGSVETIEPDGTTVVEEKDGTIITKQTDGTVITETPDKTVITEQPNGTVETKKPDGTTITEKPDGTVETKKPNGETEIKKPDGTTITEKPTAPPTKKPTEPSTSEPSTENTTNAPIDNDPLVNYDNFTIKYNSSNQLRITKYTGKDKIVRVPNTYNGACIDAIDRNTFQNNSKIEKIVFTSNPNFAPPVVEGSAINNCSLLKEVVFDWNDLPSRFMDERTIIMGFAVNCSNLTNIEINNCSKYKFVENGFYYVDYYTSLYYYCHNNSNEWHQPSWCTGGVAYGLFNDHPEITKLYIDPSNGGLSSYLSKYLTAVYIDENNDYYYDDYGVVYTRDGLYCRFYPPQKNNKSYTIKDGYCFASHYKCDEVNPNIETLYIPKNVTFCPQCLRYYLTTSNLQTIYIQEGNRNIDYIKETFKGTVIVYQ